MSLAESVLDGVRLARAIATASIAIVLILINTLDPVVEEIGVAHFHIRHWTKLVASFVKETQSHKPPSFTSLRVKFGKPG